MADTATDERKLAILGDLMNAKLAHDIDRLIALYDAACVIEQPSLGIHRTGHAEIRPSLELFARHFPDYRREIAGVAFTDDTVVSRCDLPGVGHSRRSASNTTTPTRRNQRRTTRRPMSDTSSHTAPASDAHEQIRVLLGTAVPFATLVGVEIIDLGDGHASARLEPHPDNLNHIATLHAGAVFTLAEAASGAALAGVFADRILEITAVVRTATVSYRRPALRTVVATADVDREPIALRSQLGDDGRVELTVEVTVRHDDHDDAVATMQFDWIVTSQ
jgi:uncharacterized protein (TIGR00369 family)